MNMLRRRHRRAPYLTITDAEFEKLRDFHQRVPELLREIIGDDAHQTKTLQNSDETTCD